MTKRWIFGACMVLLVMLTATSASAQVVQMVAKLSGGNETPNKVLTGAFGSAECAVDVPRGTIACNGTVYNLPSGATAGHIHVGANDVAGPVVCAAEVTPNVSNDFTFTISCDASKIILRPDQGIRSYDDFVQSVVGENTYINIHSAANPGGEIRGQLLLKN
jgi:CHRD domain